MGRGVTLWCGLLLAIGLSGEMALATPNLPPDPPSVAQNLQANPSEWTVLESNSFRALSATRAAYAGLLALS